MNEKINELVQEIREEIEKIADFFYRQKDNQGYTEFDMLLVNLTSLVDELFGMKENTDAQNRAIEITEVIKSLFEAMQIRDTVMMSDILQYDLIGTLDRIN